MAENQRESSRNNLTVKVDVDVSDALTGLKALKREAILSAKALSELADAVEKLKAKEIDPNIPITINVNNPVDIDQIAKALADNLKSRASLL